MEPQPSRPNQSLYCTVAALMLTVLAGALTIATWGFIALFTASDPIETADISLVVGPLSIVLALVVMFLSMFRIGKSLQHGHSRLPWSLILLAGIGAYLVAAIVFFAVGLPPHESFYSAFLLALLPIGWLCALCYWAMVARRIYTDRGRPRWPWENPEDV
ncbi:hypothetical protein [Lysinibacter sp. HNR]|uniref:hypothetical protein n=1 Tax=Lysinibacter sp. HNR TaxID=3031408 RepID=UPI002434B629|nr:hypothetical protein [Lysinibacter sp. HNR]WGD36763.1 hypothetical protein FrondiHNR_09885 [Lysinibacter sp. HNR]